VARTAPIVLNEKISFVDTTTVMLVARAFGIPLPCVAINVASPLLALMLSSGMYCFTHKCIGASMVAVARAYSRMCEHGTVCSIMLNGDSILG
jgi:hypothetical protein